MDYLEARNESVGTLSALLHQQVTQLFMKKSDVKATTLYSIRTARAQTYSSKGIRVSIQSVDRHVT